MLTKRPSRGAMRGAVHFIGEMSSLVRMPPIATTALGDVSGTEEEMGAMAFRAIPYALAPVGERRFRPAEPPEPWTGVRDGSRFGPMCPQPITALEHFLGVASHPTSEDCCYLNVWTPALQGSRPVMVWFHGGAFINGAGSVPLYDGTRLAAKEDVVVVTCNYRLGVFGYSDLSPFGSEEYRFSANAGLSDQLAVLRWVAENAPAFGGDPGRVCVFGESAGATSIAALFGCPSADGLFARAILQSGTSPWTRSQEQAARDTAALAEAAGIEQREAIRLADLPTEAILAAQDRLLARGPSVFPFGPVADGDLVREDPPAALASGAFAKGEILTGANRDEARLFRLVYPELVQLAPGEDLRARIGAVFGTERAELSVTYRDAMEHASDPERWEACLTEGFFHLAAQDLLDSQAAGGGRCFGYRFEWDSPAFGGLLGACHGLEVPFPFDNLDREGAAAMVGSSPSASRLAERMRSAWGLFARSGTPGAPPPLKWSPWHQGERAAMLIGEQWAETADPFGAAAKRWAAVRG